MKTIDLLAALCIATITATAAAGEKPNIILIMVDDMGFSDIRPYGGEIDTPNLDSLAKNGLRFTQFYNSARCCPTRATLLTGLHPHQAGIGHMTGETAAAGPDKAVPPAYAGNLNDSCVTLAQVARSAGYATFMTGKWHLSGKDEADWPLQRGFDRYYGCLSGATHHFQPYDQRIMYDGNKPDPEPKSTTSRPFYTTDAFTDHAIRFIDEHKTGPGIEKPFFLYLAYTAPHWPIHAHDQEIAKYRGKYKSGWDQLREQRYQRQIASGLIPAAWKMTSRDPEVPAWDSLDESKRDQCDHRMAAYAAMIDRVDQKIGDLLATLKKHDAFDNTLILFLSDNGACAEVALLGGGDPVKDRAPNTPLTRPALGKAWANACNTPYRLYKHFTHEGGANTPFIAHWPARIKPGRDWFRQPAQLIDVMATVVDLTGAPYPETLDGRKILPIDGIPLTPAFDGKPLERKSPVFIEHENNASVRDGDWKLVGREVSPPRGLQKQKWELYNLKEDGTELNDLAKVHPGKVESMSAQWEAWARRVGVFPKPGAAKPARPKGRVGNAAALVDPAMSRAEIEAGLKSREASALFVHAKPPNIVVFLSDDHTLRDSSAYGSPDIATPNMARLAKDGMTFDRAYVASPSCAPSRAALLTGLYPANNGAEANHSRPRADIKKLPAHLKDLGYEVVSFGKVGHYKQTPEYGFDLARHFNYHEDIAIPKAIEWLRARKSHKPLCLLVGTNWPHVPWPDDIAGIDPKALKIPSNHVTNPVTRRWRARYIAAIRKMDEDLGLVHDTAREILGADTFFLHTSDHGAQWPFGKWNLYEDGIHTPLIASWPGTIKPGTRTRAMVSWIDILPTLVEAAGGKAPENIDGHSFLPVLRGEKDAHRDAIFTTHSGDGDNNVYPIRSVVTADGWKYIRNLHPEFLYTSHVTNSPGDSGYWKSWLASAAGKPAAARKVRAYQQRPAEELYQLAADPWEASNLIADPAHAPRAAELRKRLDQWMGETKDPQKVFGKPQLIAAAGKPNIITVFVDDMGWSDISCFGGDVVKTQHLDRLAAEGLRFSNFCVNSPICSPSRVALTTGQYPQRWRITSFLNNRRNNEERGMAQWLDPAAPVLARELRKNGYATGHFGKWHMGGQRDVNDAPAISQYGFDQSLTNFEGMGAKLLPLTMTPKSDKPGRIWADAEILGGPVTWMQRSEITGGFVKAALGFIDQAQMDNKPFFVNVWPDDVHSPFFPPVDRWGKDKRKLYQAVLDRMDEQLAPLFDRIRDDEKLRRNTLIVFCSDNGPEPGAGTSDPLRGNKGWLYEGGIRSSLIVWGPGLLAGGAAGTVNNEAVLSSIDINRSLYAITGTPLPEGATLDGENLADSLLGRTTAGRATPVFFRRPPDRPGEARGQGAGDNPDLAVRDGKWKYLINYDGSAPQLYDLVADPAETKNLAQESPEVAARLKQWVFNWNATLPADAGDPSSAR